MGAWGSGSCSLHSRIPSIQDGRQGVWKEKGGEGGRASPAEERAPRPAGLGTRAGRRAGAGAPGARPGRGAGGAREGVREGERGRGGEPRGRDARRKSPGRRRWQAEERNEETCVGIGSSQRVTPPAFRFYSLSGGEGVVWALSLVFPLPSSCPPTPGHLFALSFRNNRNWEALGTSRRGGFPLSFSSGGCGGEGAGGSARQG